MTPQIADRAAASKRQDAMSVLAPRDRLQHVARRRRILKPRWQIRLALAIGAMTGRQQRRRFVEALICEGQDFE